MHQEYLSPEYKKYISAIAISILTVLTLISLNQIRTLFSPPEPNGTIIVEGEGQVSLKPDQATLQLGVRTEAETVLTAQTNHTNSTNALINEIKALGLPESDIQTQSYYMRENRFWDQDEQDYIKRGWMITETVDVTINDTDLIDSVLDAAGRNGVTDISGPNFEISETYDYEAQARKEAILQAEQKAEELSQELGIRLGAVVDYNEWINNGDQFEPYYAEMHSAGIELEQSFQLGEDDITALVSITYQIR